MSSNKNMNSEEHLVQSRRTSRKVIQGTSPESTSYGQDKYAAKSPKPYKQKSILKDQQAPSPYLSPSNGVLRTFMPNNCGPMNSKDPLETVVNLFDAPIRLAANQKAIRNSIGGCQQHDRSNEQRTPSNGNPEEYSSVPPSAINSYIQDIASQNDNKNIIPKTEAQKRHEMEMLRGVYHDSRQGNNVGHSKRMSLDLPSNYKANIKPALAQSGSIDISVHDAIWGSDSAESPSRKMNVLPTRGPRHSTGGINTKTMSASSPNFATDFGSLAKSVMSRQESVGSGIKDDFMSQLSRCNGTGQESPPRLSNLFRNGDAKKDENATPSSALSMFEEIQRQIIGKTNVDSSGFPTSENTDPNRRAEQDQRLKEKLDAVRARSVRNAEIFEKMESEKKYPMPKKEEQQQASFASFGDPVATSEGHPSAEKTTAGKKLDPFLDKITEAAWSNNNHIVCNDDSKSRFACSPRVASEATGRTCSSRVTPETSEEELGHYMYVAYSQFGEDARRVLKLCGHHSLPTPDRRNGEILIKVQASTVSSSDCAIRRGEWSNVMMDPYIIPGTAMVGRVMDMDRKKSRASFSSSSIEPGDIVLSLSTSGGNARYACLPKSNLVKLPPQIKPERAVCLAETYLTAFQALHFGQKGALRYRENSLKGKSILIMGGYSPLGKAIVELSRAGGAAFCYALVNGDNLRQQCDSLEQWGAMPLSNNPQDWLTLIGRQIDIFLTTYDPNQQEEGTHKISADHWKALKKDGQVHVVCSHPGMNEVEQREKIFASSKKEKDSKGFRIPSCRPGGREKLADRAIYYNLFDAWESDRGTKTIAKKDMEHLIQLLEVELVDPEIRESFPLAKLAKAQRSLEHKKVTGAGHLVCSPWLGDKAIGEGTPKTDKAPRGTQY